MTRADSHNTGLPDGARLDQALVRAVRRDMAMHKRLGLPIAVWQDGKAVWLPADQIPVGIEEFEHPLSRPPLTDE